MCLGTFSRLRRSLATSTLSAAVRILAERFLLYMKAISCKVKKENFRKYVLPAKALLLLLYLYDQIKSPVSLLNLPDHAFPVPDPLRCAVYSRHGNGWFYQISISPGARTSFADHNFLSFFYQTRALHLKTFLSHNSLPYVLFLLKIITFLHKVFNQSAILYVFSLIF